MDKVDGPNSFLGYTIARLATVMQGRMDRALMAEVGLSVRQFGVLAHLAEDPGLGSGELSRLVMVTPQSMGPLVEKLASRGLVERLPAPRGQKRVINLTSAGRAVLRKSYRIAARLAVEEKSVLKPVDSDDLNRALLSLLLHLQGDALVSLPNDGIKH